jgi:hypothetical protein
MFTWHGDIKKIIGSEGKGIDQCCDIKHSIKCDDI